MDFITEENRVYLNDEKGKLISEVTFPNIAQNIVNINHTFVDESLRGQGIADKIMILVVQKLIADKKKAYLTCSYAQKWFSKNTDFQSIITDTFYIR